MWQALDLIPWTHSGQSNKTLFMDLISLTPKDIIYIQPNENGGQIIDFIYIYIYISFVLEYTMWQALDLKPWTHSGQSNKTVHGFNIIIFFFILTTTEGGNGTQHHTPWI